MFTARILGTVPESRLTRSQIANLEAGHRQSVTLEELAAFAATLGVDPWSLTSTPVCLSCHNRPPVGFVCSACRMEGSPP